MTETKAELTKSAELSESDLDLVHGGIAQGNATKPGKQSSTDDQARPFVVDGPYT